MEKIHKISLRKYLRNESTRKKLVSVGMITTPTQKDSGKALDCLENMLENVDGDVAFDTEIHSTKKYFFFTKYFATAEAYRFAKPY